MLFTRRFWLGVVVTLGFLALFLWKVDFSETGRELQGASYSFFLPAVLCYFLSLGVRSLRWRLLLLHLKPVSISRLYPVVSIGYMANNILPVRLGELVRAHFLGEKEGVSKASVLSTIGVERVLDGLTLLLFVIIVWPFLPWTDVLRNDEGDLRTAWLVGSVAVALAFLAAFLFVCVLAASPRLGDGLVRVVPALLPAAVRGRVREVLRLLLNGLGALRSPRAFLSICLLSGPVWLLEGMVYYIMALSFDLGQPFSVILLVTATSNLATAIPSSIGGIGPFEVVAKSTLVAFGVGAEAAAAYAFSVHILALWLPVNILGLLFLWRENVSLAQVARTAPLEISAEPPVCARPAGASSDGSAGGGASAFSGPQGPALPEEGEGR